MVPVPQGASPQNTDQGSAKGPCMGQNQGSTHRSTLSWLPPVSSTGSTGNRGSGQASGSHCSHRMTFFRFFSAQRETHGTHLSVCIFMGYSVLFLKHITLLWWKSSPARVLAGQGGSAHPRAAPALCPCSCHSDLGSSLLPSQSNVLSALWLPSQLHFFQAPTKKQL